MLLFYRVFFRVKGSIRPLKKYTKWLAIIYLCAEINKVKFVV